MRRTGKVAPYRDENGKVLPRSVAEVTRVQIGGMEQGMVIKGRSLDNPVLLSLHGGPGASEYLTIKAFPLNLEDYFTVCWWDQRGCGLSWEPNIQPGTITLEQMISDTIEVTNYLRRRFGKEKIYVMGHSWGSFLGVHVVDRNPELFEAYIGIGQTTNGMESEKQAYACMLDTARRSGDRKTEKKLLAYQVTDLDSLTPEYLTLRSNITRKQGTGIFHVPRSYISLLLPYILAKEYTLRDKYGCTKGVECLNQPVNEPNFSVNLSEAIPKLQVPVYIFHGIHDVQVSYQLAREYFDILDAPVKRFYAFEHSAHCPHWEEPEKFMEIIRRDIAAAGEGASRSGASF